MSATSGRTQPRGGAFRDRAPQVAVVGIAFTGSFSNILALCAEHGVHGLEAWATAAVVDLMAMISADERQRDKAIDRPRRGWISFPTVVLVGTICLSLAMNLAVAHEGPWGHIISVVSLVAMLMIVFMMERRAAHEDRVRRAADAESGTEAEADSRTAILVPAAGPVPGPEIPVPGTAPVSGTRDRVPGPTATGGPVPAALAAPATEAAPAASPPSARHAVPRAPHPGPPAYSGPRSVDHLLADARRHNADYRAAHGKPIPLADLRAALSCNNGLASQIRNQVLAEEEQVA